MALRALYLSTGMLAAIALYGMSVYSSEAMSGKVAHDGYGVSSTLD